MALNFNSDFMENYYTSTLARCMPLEPDTDNKRFRQFVLFLYVYLLHTFRYTIHFLNFLRRTIHHKYLKFIQRKNRLILKEKTVLEINI